MAHCRLCALNPSGLRHRGHDPVPQVHDTAEAGLHHSRHGQPALDPAHDHAHDRRHEDRPPGPLRRRAIKLSFLPSMAPTSVHKFRCRTCAVDRRARRNRSGIEKTWPDESVDQLGKRLFDRLRHLPDWIIGLPEEAATPYGEIMGIIEREGGTAEHDRCGRAGKWR